MRYPYVVVYREGGKQVQEGFRDPAKANERLNELWGECGPRGPERHSEARAVLALYANRDPRR